MRIFFASFLDVFHSPALAGEAVQAEIACGGSVCGGSGDFRLESQSSKSRTMCRCPCTGEAEGRQHLSRLFTKPILRKDVTPFNCA